MRFVSFSYFYPLTQWEGNLGGILVQETETDQPTCSLNPFPFLIDYISQRSMRLGATMIMSFGPKMWAEVIYSISRFGSRKISLALFFRLFSFSQ